MQDLHIEVKLNYEVKDINQIPADEVIIATGAKPRSLNIKGKEKAIEALDYLMIETKLVKMLL